MVMMGKWYNNYTVCDRKKLSSAITHSYSSERFSAICSFFSLSCFIQLAYS